MPIPWRLRRFGWIRGNGDTGEGQGQRTRRPDLGRADPSPKSTARNQRRGSGMGRAGGPQYSRVTGRRCLAATCRFPWDPGGRCRTLEKGIPLVSGIKNTKAPAPDSVGRFSLVCPSCEAELTGAKDLVGTVQECPSCGGNFRVVPRHAYLSPPAKDGEGMGLLGRLLNWLTDGWYAAYTDCPATICRRRLRKARKLVKGALGNTSPSSGGRAAPQQIGMLRYPARTVVGWKAGRGRGGSRRTPE
jgi:hypothetical protein